jgi:hypothetical protein
VDHATVLHYLREKLGFKSSCLRWAPRLLTGELKAKCKELTQLIILYRKAARKDGWRHLVRGDEPWLFLLSGSRRMLALAKDEVAIKTRIDIQSKSPCFESYRTHTVSASLIGSRLMPKSTAHIMPLTFFSRSTRPSFRKGEICMESDGCARRRLLGSQKPDQRIVHENSGHDFDSTSAIFSGPAA